MLTMIERRSTCRRPVDLFFNKFLEGYPYLCRTLDVSPSGALVETFAEPDSEAERFPLELRFPGDRSSLWLWARRVRSKGRVQALEFMALTPPVQRHLRRWLDARG